MRIIQNSAIVCSLLLLGMGCRTREEKAASDLKNAQQKTTEERQDLSKQRNDVVTAQTDEARARQKLVDTMDEKLRNLDARIEKLKTDSTTTVDQTKLAQLRGEIASLRAQAADTTKTLPGDLQTNYDKLVRDVETELDRK